jgi:hypothetical protein
MMGPELVELALTILRWVGDYQPGIVACELIDAEGRRHSFVGKLPIWSTDESLNATSKYPQQGGVRCTALARWNDGQLLRVSIAEPDDEPSTEGLTEFVVSRAQVSPIPRGHREPNPQGVLIWVEDE